ncbi:MerR family transcriptional regulator [Cellulosilyticum sp. ST5]|uniref:MerR family transcriptional regulator n=1 Tax=Cellulosilyticum sp. ST5 TaxID=3055805 RepID=UPI0039776738
MYTIGQVAKFLGVSRDTLKFYEEKELVKPKQDDENGYRKYNDYDIYDVITTNFYRHLDIEVKKIQEIRQSKSIIEIEELLGEKKRRIEEEIAYKQLLLKRLEEVEEGCKNIRDYLGKYTIKEMPLLLIKGEISDFMAYDEYEMIKKNTDQLKETVTLTDIRRIISFDEKGVTGDKCVVVNAIEKAEVPVQGKILSHPKCIYTIVENGRWLNGENDVAEHVEAYLRKVGMENGYEPVGVVYVNILLTTYEEGVERIFLEIYAPIKN